VIAAREMNLGMENGTVHLATTMSLAIELAPEARLEPGLMNMMLATQIDMMSAHEAIVTTEKNIEMSGLPTTTEVHRTLVTPANCTTTPIATIIVTNVQGLLQDPL